MSSFDIKKGRYKHYKGDIMEVVGTALHSENQEEFVVYKHVTGERSNEYHFWVRPIAMFLEDVNIDGRKIPRFRYIDETDE